MVRAICALTASTSSTSRGETNDAYEEDEASRGEDDPTMPATAASVLAGFFSSTLVVMFHRFIQMNRTTIPIGDIQDSLDVPGDRLTTCERRTTEQPARVDGFFGKRFQQQGP